MSRSKWSSKASSTRSITQDIDDTELTADDQQELVKRFKALVKERTGKELPATIRGSSSGAPPAPCSAPG